MNIIFIIMFLILAYKFRENIYNKVHSITNQEKVLSLISPYSIVMLGNSITDLGKWNKDLDRNDVLNSGMGGFTTSHFVITLNKKVLHYKPKICFIQGGINDIFVGIPLNRVYENFESIIDTLIKNKIEPVIQSTLYVNKIDDSITNSKVDSINNFLTELAVRKNIHYVDLNIFLSENRKLKKEYTYDGLHLNESAYKVWAEEIKKILELKGI